MPKVTVVKVRDGVSGERFAVVHWRGRDEDTWTSRSLSAAAAHEQLTALEMPAEDIQPLLDKARDRWRGPFSQALPLHQHLTCSACGRPWQHLSPVRGLSSLQGW